MTELRPSSTLREGEVGIAFPVHHIVCSTASRQYDLLVSFQQMSDDWHADFEDAHRADGIIFLGYGDYITYMEKLIHLNEVGAISGIEACGMTVPEDYPLTTVQQNTRMAGELLVDNLLKMIEGENPSPSFCRRT